MKIFTFSPVHFEKWDYRNSVEKGIGGSETSTVEMSWRLAQLGHEVINYAPIPEDCPGEYRGSKWLPLEAADFSEPGLWVLYRCPEILDHFDGSRTDQVRWLMFQDYDYPTLTPPRNAKLHRAMVLCHAHARYLANKCPELIGKIWVTRNAIKNDLIAQVEAQGIPPRDNKRIMYASSPDRGLLTALKIFRRAKEVVPDLSFYATYGYNNLDKLIAQGGPRMAAYQREKEECLRIMEETGAQFLGRIPQQQLYQEWLKTGMNVYITSFAETGWITGLESQALGAIPIFSPVCAQGENTRWGISVPGEPKDPMTIANAAIEVIRLATDDKLQERLRGPMMEDVRANWGWEQFVHLKKGENWVEAAEEDFARLANPTTAVMFADNDDEREARKRFLHLNPGDVMIDVGACDGSWTVPAAKQGATVWAIDPGAMQSRLQEEVTKANVQKQVKIIPLFAGDRSGLENACSLDSLALEAKLDRVDFMKIDVEGQEMSVLRGASALTRRFLPAILVEVHEEVVEGVRVTPQEVEEYLHGLDCGYKFTRIRLLYNGKVYWHLFAKVEKGSDNNGTERLPDQ